MKNSLYIIDQKHKQIFYNWQSVFVSKTALTLNLVMVAPIFWEFTSLKRKHMARLTY